MKNNRILFIIISIIFVLILLFIVIDFSRKTNFPGSKGRNTEVTLSKELSVRT
jgi:hypothetical protein